jgi:hypothetical protein
MHCQSHDVHSGHNKVKIFCDSNVLLECHLLVLLDINYSIFLLEYNDCCCVQLKAAVLFINFFYPKSIKTLYVKLSFQQWLYVVYKPLEKLIQLEWYLHTFQTPFSICSVALNLQILDVAVVLLQILLDTLLFPPKMAASFLALVLVSHPHLNIFPE